MRIYISTLKNCCYLVLYYDLLRHAVCNTLQLQLHLYVFALLFEGYGASSVKSSTTPQEMKPLAGIFVHKVACGWGHTLLIARTETEEDKAKIESLPVFEP